MAPMISEENFFKRIGRLLMEPFKDPRGWLKVLTVKDYAKSTSIHFFMQHLDSTLKFKSAAILALRPKLKRARPPALL